MKGSASLAYQDRKWNGNNAPGGTTNAFELLQTDASLGGPLFKNRTWFFGAYRFTTNSLGVSRTTAQIANLQALVPGFEPMNADNEASYFFAKVSARLADPHRLEAFWQRDHNPENAVGPNWSGKFLKRDFGGIATGFRLASVWGRSLSTRVNVSFNNKGIDAELASEQLPSRNVHRSAFLSSGRLVGTGILVVLDNLSAAAIQPADKLTLSADATWYRDVGTGSHELQAGVYLQPRLRDRSTQHYANGGFALEEVVLRDPANLSSPLIPFHRQVFELVDTPFRWADGSDYAVYVQDAWRPFRG